MKLLIIITFIGALMLTAASCNVISPESPVISTVNIPLPPQPVSEIDVPVNIELDDLFKKAESSVPPENSGSDNPCEGVRYSYLFQRSPLAISGNGQRFNLSFEGRYKFSGAYCAKCVFGNCVVPKVGFSCGDGSEPMRRIAIGYISDISIHPNYAIQTKTELTTLSALDRCRVTVANIDLTDRVIEGIRGPLASLCSKVDEKTAQIGLRPSIQKIWDKASQPLPIGEFGFINVNPKSLRLSTLNMHNSTLNFSIGVSVNPVISTVRDSSASSQVPELGDYKPVNGFNVYTDLKLDYAAFSNQLNKQLASKTINIVNNEFTISKVSLYGAGNSKVVCVVDFEGTRKGTLYLVGTPVYNSITRQLSVPDLTFDIKTKNLLLQVAKWLLNPKITSEFRRVAVYNISNFLTDAKSKLTAELNKELNNGIFIQGSIHDLSLQNIYPETSFMLVRTLANGNVSIGVNGLGASGTRNGFLSGR